MFGALSLLVPLLRLSWFPRNPVDPPAVRPLPRLAGSLKWIDTSIGVTLRPDVLIFSITSYTIIPSLHYITSLTHPLARYIFIFITREHYRILPLISWPILTNSTLLILWFTAINNHLSFVLIQCHFYHSWFTFLFTNLLRSCCWFLTTTSHNTITIINNIPPPYSVGSAVVDSVTPLVTLSLSSVGHSSSGDLIPTINCLIG